jgi:uncharacterized protein
VKLAGALAVISGASSGIGKATAIAFAAKGAQVVLLARRRDALDQAVAEITSRGGDASAYDVDLTDAQALQRATDAIKRDVGIPDIIVNNAGAGRWLFTEETPPDEAVQMMAVPYFAAFGLTRAFMPEMLARRSGRIVNMGSPGSFAPWPGATGYTAARFAMRGFTAALRADLDGTGIGVTLVVPGEVRSAYFEANPGTAARMPGAGKFFPVLSPEQVADAIVRAVERGSALVVLPFALRIMLALHGIWPWPLERLMVRTGWSHKKGSVD